MKTRQNAFFRHHLPLLRILVLTALFSCSYDRQFVNEILTKLIILIDLKIERWKLVMEMSIK